MEGGRGRTFIFRFFDFFHFFGETTIGGHRSSFETRGLQKKINEHIVDWTPFPFISEGANNNGG